MLNQTSTDVRNNLSFRLSFSYRLGKLTDGQSSKKKKKSVTNDDLKNGGGDN